MNSAPVPTVEDAFGPLSSASGDAESSFDLVVRARQGDAQALERLSARYLPRLQRWAHGRLPKGARGAFQGYVRKRLFNRICDLAQCRALVLLAKEMAVARGK